MRGWLAINRFKHPLAIRPFGEFSFQDLFFHVNILFNGSVIKKLLVLSGNLKVWKTPLTSP